MTFVHGKDTYVNLDGHDLSPYTNSTTYNNTADSHDVTTYGKTRHVYFGGLGDGTCTLQGIYDDTAAGPRAIIKPLVGTIVTFVFRPEGTGGPGDAVDALVTAYNESNPVADMIQWTCELQLSDTITVTGGP